MCDHNPTGKETLPMGILPFLAKCFNRVFGCFVVVSTFFTGGHTMTTEQQAYVDSCTNELVSILSFGKRADNTIYDYRLYALPFLKFCFENLGKHPSQANEADVRAYLQHIQDERNLTDRKQRQFCSTLSVFGSP